MRKNFRNTLLGFSVVLLLLMVTACQKQESTVQSTTVDTTSAMVNTVSVNDAEDATNLAVAQYQGSVPLTPDIAAIKTRGKLIVALYREDRPPFFYKDQTGRLTGIDVSLATDIARWLGVKAEFLRSSDSFDGVIDQVAAGQADVAVSKLSVTLNRAQRVSFTCPYVVFQQALLVNRLKLAALQSQHPDKDPLQLILGTTDNIAVRTATSYVDYARQTFPDAGIIQVDGADGIMQAANQGEVLAAYYDDNELKSYLHKHPDAAINLQLFVLTDRRDPIAIAVAPDNGHLLQWLNLYLDQMQGKMEIDQMVKRYQGGN
ncbi:amino acid ABC transporter substrate-binding protein [Paradesulfitobacterium aromaticivorans]